MYFIAMVVEFKLLNSEKKLRTEDAVHVHAALLNKITTVDPEIGHKLHSAYRNKQITVAIVDSNTKAATFRVTFLAQDDLTYANTLINALSSHPVLQLHAVKGEVESVNLADPVWGGIANWSDLTAPEISKSYIRLQFETPAAVTKRGTNGERFFSLFPDPVDIFSGLAKRWQAFGGPALPNDLERFIKTGGCVVADYSLHTVKFYPSERTQIGFVGQIVYEYRKQDSRYINALNALARLARFSGIGYQTTRGMGVVRVSICPK